MRKFVAFKLSLVLLSAVFVMAAVAQTPSKSDLPADAKSTDEVAKPQQQNAKLFKDLTTKLLALAVKLEGSQKPGDNDRANTIRAALDAAEKAGVDNQFRTLIAGMSGPGRQIQDVEKLISQDEELSKALLEMLTILMTDDESARIQAQIKMLEKFIKEAEELKRRQELLRTMTDSKKGDPTKIAKNQNDVANQTKDLANRMGNKGEGKPTPKEDPKSEPKASDPKAGENAADPKGDTQEIKAENKGSKPDDKSAEPKAGEPKAGEPKAGEPKAGEPKAGEPKAGEHKAGEPKAGEPKSGEPKAGQPKSGEPKAGEPNASESKAGESSSASKSQGQGKGDAKASKGPAGEAKGIGGKPSDPSQQSASSKGGGQPGQAGGASPPPPPPPQNQTPGRKSVEEAYPHQKGAEDDAQKDKRIEASKKMDTAVEKLAAAIEEMKKKLKQLREEEMLKLLANLEARCNHMLAMQIEVYENTKAIHASVVKNDNVKSNADIQKSQQQADKQKEIVAEAEKTLKLLETEGSAVAFANVLQEVMADMQAVQTRLEKAYVDTDTQTIEQNIIAMLKDMVAALKKQQQEMQNKPPGPPGQPGKPNQKLIDMLAELKLIKALQTQVNSRTTMYGKKVDGEQTADPIIQNELKQLASRQAKLQDMIQKIATQANQ